MPRSRKKPGVLEFRPADVAASRPLDQQWEPNLLFGERVEVLKLADDELPPENIPGHADAAEDTGPGSASLAAQFELLPIEWVTGEPAIETLRFELNDGLRYVGELADDVPETESDDDALERAAADSEGLSDIGQGDELERRLARSGHGSEDRQPISEEDDVGEGEAAAVGGGLPDAGEPGADGDVGDVDTSSAVSQTAGISEADFLAAIEAAREEAFQRGIAQGLEQGLQQGIERGIEEGRQRGLEEARQQHEEGTSSQQAELAAMIDALRAAATDSHRLFAPLKRLALHLAEQLVRGELSLSGEAINRLVENALMEIDHAPGNELVLSLNPEDMERWKRHAPAAFDTLELRADPSLSIGSVRVSAGESIIEDLVEHRLHQMAARLLGEVPARGFSRMTSLRMPGTGVEDIADVD